MPGVADIVETLARPVVERLGLELWDVEHVRVHGQQILRIVIDHPDGVSISQCEQVSAELDPILDREDPVPGQYLFQVASAGLERVLKRPSDFARFIGKTVEVRLYAPRAGKREFTGKLSAHDGATVTIEGEESFEMAKVAQVRLRYEF